MGATGFRFRRSAGAQVVMDTTLNAQDAEVAPAAPEGAFDTEAFMKTLPGISQPMGYFDPSGTPASRNTITVTVIGFGATFNGALCIMVHHYI